MKATQQMDTHKKDNKPKWVLLVTNYDSSKPPWSSGQACDPLEVIYRLCLIDKEGKILRGDGYLTECEHGVLDKLREAVKNGIYERREVKPATGPIYRAVK